MLLKLSMLCSKHVGGSSGPIELVEVKAEGELLASQQIRLEGIAPGAITELQLELPTLDGRETFVQLRVIKATATRYSAAEHELGQYQFQLKASTRQLQPFANPNATPLQVADERLALTLSGSGFALRFSRLDGKLADLKLPLEPGRLEQEVVLNLQKIDVDEELDRLASHVAEARRVFALPEAVGRRLDFLMQEFNREANTLGSKSVDSRTTQAAVELKVLIEQLREQVQNLE